MLLKIEIVNDEKNSLLVPNERLFYEAAVLFHYFLEINNILKDNNVKQV